MSVRRPGPAGQVCQEPQLRLLRRHPRQGSQTSIILSSRTPQIRKLDVSNALSRKEPQTKYAMHILSVQVHDHPLSLHKLTKEFPEAIEDALKTMKRYKKDHGWEDPDDRFGTVLVSGNQGESNLAGLYLAAETLAGTGVQQVSLSSIQIYRSSQPSYMLTFPPSPHQKSQCMARNTTSRTPPRISTFHAPTNSPSCTGKNPRRTSTGSSAVSMAPPRGPSNNGRA